jgi:hypothetical protein
VNVRHDRTVMRLTTNRLYYSSRAWATPCRAASLPLSPFPWAQSCSLWEQGVWPGGSAVGDRNQQFISGYWPSDDAPTKHAGRHGRIHVTGGRGWCRFGSHLALYSMYLYSTPRVWSSLTVDCVRQNVSSHTYLRPAAGRSGYWLLVAYRTLALGVRAYNTALAYTVLTYTALTY